MDNRKILTIGVGAFVFLFVVISIYLLIPRSYIKFTVAPSQVVVLVDNNDRHYINSGDSLTIAPGKHTVTVFEDGFIPDEQQIEVENGKTYDLTLVLAALTDAAKSRLNSPEYDTIKEKIDAANQAKFGKIIDDNNPVLGVLPIEERFYTISACQSQKYPYNPVAIALCIDVNLPSANSGWDYKSDALDNLRSSTFYSIDGYEIIWNVTLSDGSPAQ
jgi:hypothetical protein